MAYIKLIDRPNFRLFLFDISEGYPPEVLKDDLAEKIGTATFPLILLNGDGPDWVFDLIAEAAAEVASVVAVLGPATPEDFDKPAKYVYRVKISHDPKVRLGEVIKKLPAAA